MDLIINVRNPHGGDTYIARARGYKITASSTNSREFAAERLASKIIPDCPFTMKRVTDETWIAQFAEEPKKIKEMQVVHKLQPTQIIVNQGGTHQATLDVDRIEIHDLWRIAMHIEDKEDQRRVLEVWHLAHDMRGALQAIAAGADIKKPIATK